MVNRAFKKALHDVIMSRRAIRNMNTLYPDATPAELAAGDNVCIICREEMHTSKLFLSLLTFKFFLVSHYFSDCGKSFSGLITLTYLKEGKKVTFIIIYRIIYHNLMYITKL